MAEKEAAERFWVYALELYDQSAAQDAFLRLQDRDGADVPMLLWCLWLGSEGYGVATSVMHQAVEFSKVWREQTVEPLRNLRKALKPGIAGVPVELTNAARSHVAETEQRIEHFQMNHLAGLSTNTLDGSAVENLDRYALAAGLTLDATDQSIILEAR